MKLFCNFPTLLLDRSRYTFLRQLQRKNVGFNINRIYLISGRASALKSPRYFLQCMGILRMAVKTDFIFHFIVENSHGKCQPWRRYIANRFPTVELSALPLLPLSDRAAEKINGSRIVEGMWQGIIAEQPTALFLQRINPLGFCKGQSIFKLWLIIRSTRVDGEIVSYVQFESP